MLCREVMTSPAICCHVDDPASYAAARMRSWKIGFVPVCDGEGRVVGTVTDRDLTVRILAEGFLARSRPDALVAQMSPLRLVMTHGPVTCRPEDDLEVAEGLMRRYHKARIVCVDARGRPVGVIGVPDIAAKVSPARVGQLVREITERELR